MIIFRSLFASDAVMLDQIKSDFYITVDSQSFANIVAINFLSRKEHKYTCTCCFGTKRKLGLCDIGEKQIVIHTSYN